MTNTKKPSLEELYDSMWLHQKQDYAFATSAGRFIYGSEPGTGKTKTVLGFIKAKGGPSLILVPYNVTLGVWQREAKEWLGIDILVYTGKAEEREVLQDKIVQLQRDHLRGRNNGFIVAAYYGNQPELLPLIKWRTVIYDEYHVCGLTNRKSKAFVFAREYLKSAYVIFMSGTPYNKSLSQLWPVLHLIDKKKFRGFWNFVEEHCNVRLDFSTGARVIDPEPKNAVLSAEKLRPYIVRRTLRQVKPHLPPVIHDFIDVDMTERQYALYKTLEQEAMVLLGDPEMVEVGEGGTLILTPNAISKLVRLRQLLVSPQVFDASEPSLGIGVPTVCELTKSYMDVDEPVAIYTAYRMGVELIAQNLWKDGIVSPQHTYIITGSSGGSSSKGTVENMETAAKFQSDSSRNKALIGTITSAISYTATAARKGIVLGPEYNHLAMQQTIGRLDRANQAVGEDIDPIQFTYIRHKRSVEQKIYSKVAELQKWTEIVLNQDIFQHNT